MLFFLGEFIGTAILVLLGDAVVAGVVLNKTKSQNSGWVVISLAWGFAVTVAVYVSERLSGAHLNPAVSLALAIKGDLSWMLFFPYVIAQMLGAMFGALLVYLHYLPHWQVTEDKDAKLAVFCTAPAIRCIPANLLSEIIGTFVLVIGILSISGADMPNGLKPLIVGILVISIGLSLGGTTGYAINPARDLGPRIMHALLPIPRKRNSDWGYAFVPVVGPVIGAVLAVLLFVMIA